ncbi:MAG: branched-chain amino acid ABC transporter permease [Chloroflexi bacterium]|nr:branched-chain amino acid ABC transporter permease [Chloroflexota bacterium]
MEFDLFGLIAQFVRDTPRAVLVGITLGSIYAMIAQGYYVTHTTTNTLNFAQGEFLMIGAMVSYSLLVTGFGLGLALTAFLPGPIALVITFAVVSAILAVMGVILERIAIRPLRHLLSVGWILSTVGVSIILRNAAEIIWGREARAVPSIFGSTPIQVLPGVGIRPQEIFTAVIAIITMVLLFLFLKRSILGKMLSAVALNAPVAALMGIDVRRMIVLSYVISSILAGIAGILITPTVNALPHMGELWGLKAFAAAIIGGLENPVGILIAGLLFGVVEQYFQTFNPALRDAVTFFILIMILAWRPRGLFERASVEKV